VHLGWEKPAAVRSKSLTVQFELFKGGFVGYCWVVMGSVLGVFQLTCLGLELCMSVFSCQLVEMCAGLGLLQSEGLCMSMGS